MYLLALECMCVTALDVYTRILLIMKKEMEQFVVPGFFKMVHVQHTGL